MNKRFRNSFPRQTHNVLDPIASAMPKVVRVPKIPPSSCIARHTIRAHSHGHGVPAQLHKPLVRPAGAGHMARSLQAHVCDRGYAYPPPPLPSLRSSRRLPSSLRIHRLRAPSLPLFPISAGPNERRGHHHRHRRQARVRSSATPAARLSPKARRVTAAPSTPTVLPRRTVI